MDANDPTGIKRCLPPSWLRLVGTCRPLSGTPSDTELVPLWVCEHNPSGPVLPALIVQHYGSHVDRAPDLLVSLGRRRPEIKMDAILRRFFFFDPMRFSERIGFRP
jgi:hypothetical protein